MALPAPMGEEQGSSFSAVEGEGNADSDWNLPLRSIDVGLSTSGEYERRVVLFGSRTKLFPPR